MMKETLLTLSNDQESMLRQMAQSEDVGGCGAVLRDSFNAQQRSKLYSAFQTSNAVLKISNLPQVQQPQYACGVHIVLSSMFAQVTYEDIITGRATNKKNGVVQLHQDDQGAFTALACLENSHNRGTTLFYVASLLQAAVYRKRLLAYDDGAKFDPKLIQQLNLALSQKLGGWTKFMKQSMFNGYQMRRQVPDAYGQVFDYFHANITHACLQTHVLQPYEMLVFPNQDSFTVHDTAALDTDMMQEEEQRQLMQFHADQFMQHQFS